MKCYMQVKVQCAKGIELELRINDVFTDPKIVETVQWKKKLAMQKRQKEKIIQFNNSSSGIIHFIKKTLIFVYKL